MLEALIVGTLGGVMAVLYAWPVSVMLVTRSCEDLHDNRVADRDLRTEELIQRVAHARARVAEELDPS